jgi:hypothetical protein
MYQVGGELLLSNRLSDSREVTPMFDHQCTACGKRQLIFPAQITSMDNTEHGIVVAFRCWCGADQTTVTGRKAAGRREPRLAA